MYNLLISDKEYPKGYSFFWHTNSKRARSYRGYAGNCYEVIGSFRMRLFLWILGIIPYGLIQANQQTVLF